MSEQKEKKVSWFEKLKNFAQENKLPVKIERTDETPEVSETREKFNAYIKENFSEDKIEKFMDVVLADGTMGVIEPALEEGAQFVIMDSEGNPVPAPPSEYQLEDGTVIVVEVDGIIAAVQAPSAEGEEAEPAAEEEMEQTIKRIIESTTKEFAKVEDLNTVKESIADEKTTDFLLGQYEAVVEKYNSVVDYVEKLNTFFQEFSEEVLNQPKDKPVVKQRTPLKKEAKENIFLKTKNEK